MKRLLLLLTAFLLCSYTHSNAQISEGGTPLSFDVTAKNFNDNIPSEWLPTLNLEQVRAESENNGRYKVGEIIPVDYTTNNSGLWQTLPNGDRIWRLKVQADNNAKGLNPYFDDFYLPAGAKLFLYNEYKEQVLGAYTQQNNPTNGTEFAIDHIRDNNFIIEYYEPAGTTDQVRLSMSDVGYAYRGVKSLRETRDFGDSGACEVNVNCSPVGDDWQDEKNGVARILLRVNAGQFFCSGSLVNNVRQDCTPYFLTAMHCGTDGNVLTTAANLNQWIFYFNYEAAACANPASQPTLNTVTGCSVNANSTGGGGGANGSDFLLLTLNTTPPAAYNVYYNGWDAVNATTNAGTGLHHPAGDIMKISTFTSNLASTSWAGVTANTHWQVVWSANSNGWGVTEGGSSGSPLFNNAAQIVGTLSAGSSQCTNQNGPDIYGKTSFHWTSGGAAAASQLKPWLDPDNTGTLVLGGVYAPCGAPPVAGCTIYTGGPYGDQAIDVAGCTGESVAAPYAAWQNELYFSDVIAGGNYTFELVGCNATAWGGPVEITLIEGGTAAGGNVTGGTSTVVTGCTITFTATTTGTAYFVVTTVGGCGTALAQVDNGVPTITTNSGVACGTCGDNICESTENYCNCAVDCDCTGGEGILVTGYDTGAFAASTAPVAYCASEVSTGVANPAMAAVYVPFAPNGGQACVTDWTTTTNFGTLYASTDPISVSTGTIADFNIGLLELTDADLAASGGTITITFTDATTTGACTFDLVIDMSTAVNAAGTAWAGTAAAACPGVCTPPAGTFVSYDCAGPSVTIEITDLGSPTAGSAGFTAEVRTGSGFVVSGGIPLAIGNVTIPLPDNTQVYDVIFTDGLTDGCNVGFGNSLYGDCRQAAGPAAGCSFIMDDASLDGSFEDGLWTETPAASGTISAAFPLDDLTHVFLGGFGTANTNSVSQTITIPASTAATMHYWIWFGACAAAADVYQVTIDGTVVQTFNGGDARCGGNWGEETIDLSAYADGGSHTIVFTLTETGSVAGSSTAILVDDVIIEACGTSCATDLVLSTSEVGSQTYVVANSITSTDVTAAGEVVVYDAGQINCMENGFTAVANSDFSAIIGGCAPLVAPPVNQLSQQLNTIVNTNTKASRTGLVNLAKEAQQVRTIKQSKELKSLK